MTIKQALALAVEKGIEVTEKKDCFRVSIIVTGPNGTVECRKYCPGNDWDIYTAIPHRKIQALFYTKVEALIRAIEFVME